MAYERIMGLDVIDDQEYQKYTTQTFLILEQEKKTIEDTYQDTLYQQIGIKKEDMQLT